MKILVSIFEVASVAVPLFIALLFLARSGESYREKYDVSKFRFWGFSRRQYVLFFRLVGVLFLLLACFAVYKNYIEEPSAEYNETKEFWDEINKRSGDVFSMAALLGAAIAIPARMASTRFPGKPLALLGGKAVIERVYQACKKSEFAEKTVILTDSIEIAEFADSISAPVVMTSEKCRSGTERIIEAFTGKEKALASVIGETIGISTNKASALCRQLVAEKKMTVEEVKVPKKGMQKAYTVV